jgi:hypothetical protein
MFKLKKVGKTVISVASGVLASASAFAVDHSAAINAAYTDGNTNVTAAVVGIITLAAVAVGVGVIISLFRRT